MADAPENQFLGALLGMAIGDALGAPISGLDRDGIRDRFGIVDRYLGAQPLDAEEIFPGEFTDETEVALCIVESMTVNRGHFDAETTGVRMLHLAAGPSRRWMHEATLAALDASAASLEFLATVDEDGEATGDVASRGVPVGLLHAVGRFNPDHLRADAEAVTRLTHGGPAAFNATTAVAYGIRLAATGIPRHDWARETADFLGGGELAEKLHNLDAELEQDAAAYFDHRPEPGLAAAEAVPAAFVAAMTEPVFENAVLTAINAGGAADTVGALTGALAGAAGGGSGIPQHLIDDLGGRIYISLAAPWFHRAARQRSGQLIDLRPVHGPRPDMPPRR